MATQRQAVLRRAPLSPKVEWIRFRVTSEQKARMTVAAERSGLGLSAWLRMLALRAASASEKGAKS